MTTRTIGLMSLAALLCAGAQAASISTTATLNGAASLGTTGAVSATGSGTLTNIGAVTFTATASIGSTALTGPITITVTSGGTLTGTISLPLTILTGGSSSSSASVVITGGTGTYAGSTGTLSGNGTGSVGLSGITFTFTGSGTINTSGGGTTAPIPTITAVLDAASYTSSIAQGSIFVVKGTNLSASGYQSAGFPLPTTFNNVKITFSPTNGGSSTDVYMVYTYNQGGVNQLAALLPSPLAIGNYNVTVTNSGQAGPPFSAAVVKSKFGLITRDSTGNGLAVVQNYGVGANGDVDAYTTQSVGGLPLSPAKPGTTMVAYGTGLGPIPTADNVAASVYDFTKNGATVQVVVGGMTITPSYAGRSACCSGLDQINFVLPANVPTGCAVTFQVSVNGTLSPATYISIASDPSSSACVLPGYTAAQLAQFDQGANIYGGGFSLSQYAISTNFGTGPVNAKLDSLAGELNVTSGFELTAAQANASISTSTIGSCTVFTASGASGGATAGGVSRGMDAGTITATGPSGSNLSGSLTETSGALSGGSTSYTYSSSQLGYEGLSGIPGVPTPTATLVAGTYTLSAAGGADVNAFNTSITVGAPLTVTGGLPASVNRAAGLTVNFTGGNPSDIVSLSGQATSGTGTSAVVTEFVCTAPASAGAITAPASITSQLPASASGSLNIGSGSYNAFNASLKAGGSFTGVFYASFGTGASPVNFQ